MILDAAIVNMEGILQMSSSATVPFLGRKQGVHLEYVAATVTIHHHIHLGCLNQRWINVESKEILFGRF